ncbi:hypothetical protein LWI29_031542 [Acer saccharum]|uniref:Uncharacterized protein n=1 Tax=Acer saccharum TaxID=4024 RepID=A0AA39S6V6_ACESA|nr:hypothetical protein LWI29_031542 [Acer saccharum]
MTRIAKQEVLPRVGMTRIGKQEVMARVGRTRIVMHGRLPRGKSALDRVLTNILVGLGVWLDIDSDRAGPDQEGPLQVVSILGPSSLPPAAGSGENDKVGSQDPPSIQEKTRPGSSHEIRLVESPVEAGVLRDDPSQVADEG